MKPLTVKSQIKIGLLTVLLPAAMSIAACSSTSAQGSDQSRLAMQSNQQCAAYQDCRDQDGFLIDNPSGERLSPGVNFGRWMAGGSD